MNLIIDGENHQDGLSMGTEGKTSCVAEESMQVSTEEERHIWSFSFIHYTSFAKLTTVPSILHVPCICFLIQ